MAVTLPPSLAVGDDITAAFLDNLAALIALIAEPVFFQATYSTTQSLTNNTPTALTLDTEVIDTYGGHSGSASTYTVPAALNGMRVDAAGSASFAANGTGVRVALIWHNGATVSLGQNGAPGSAANSLAVEATATFIVATGDTISVAADQTSGGALSTVASASGLTLSWGGLT